MLISAQKPTFFPQCVVKYTFFWVDQPCGAPANMGDAQFRRLFDMIFARIGTV
jgi:hypothetical protein